jgi:hypothetical protein
MKLELQLDDGPAVFSFRCPTEDEWCTYLDGDDRVDARTDLALATCSDPSGLRKLVDEYAGLLSGQSVVDAFHDLSGASAITAEVDWAGVGPYHGRHRRIGFRVDGKEHRAVMRAPTTTEYRMIRKSGLQGSRSVIASLLVFQDAFDTVNELRATWPGLLDSTPFAFALRELLGMQDEVRKKK